MSRTQTSRLQRLAAHRAGPARASWLDKLAQRQAQAAEQQAVAALLGRAETEFQSQITEVRVRLLDIADGEDAAELLGIVAVVVGTPMQFIYTTRQGTVPAWAGQLRGALKTVVQMCLQDYRWQEQYALAIERAVEVAATADVGTIDASNMAQWRQAWLDACYLCNRIQDRQVDGTEVA